jgi:hypothetical protein
MIHSQFKIVYPECPFIWDYDDIKNVFTSKVKKANRINLLKDIIDVTKSDTIKSDTTHSDTTHSDTTKSDNTKSNTKCYNTKSDTTHSDTTKSDNTKSNTKCYNTKSDNTDNDTVNNDNIDHDTVKSNIMDNVDEDIIAYCKGVVDYLLTITDEATINIYDNIKYTFISQKIPRTMGDMRINFHTCAYNDDNNSSIDKEYESNISWCLIPIVGNVTMTNNEQYIINNNPVKTITSNYSFPLVNKSEPLDPTTYQGVIDNNYDTVEARVRCDRTGRRNFVKRINEEIIEKKDIINNEFNQTNTHSLQPLREIKQINMNNNTRASAQLIRERLGSSYKAYRFRQNPELFKQQTKIDMSLRNIAHNIAACNNDKIIKNGVIKNEIFDFVHDKITIRKVSGILRFGPYSSGRIKINAIPDDKFVYFVTVLRHQRNLHITVHYVKFL